MWTKIVRTLTAPLRIASLLTRIVRLLEENNDLLRDLHLKNTGRHSLVPRRSLGTFPSTPLVRHAGNRVKSGTDVWQHTPPSEIALQEKHMRSHEAAASQPTDGSEAKKQADDAVLRMIEREFEWTEKTDSPLRKP